MSTATLADFVRPSEESATARALRERFGPGAALVVSLARELGGGLGDAIELLSTGSPEFRAACGQHLADRRAAAATERAERAREQRAADLRNMRASLSQTLEGLRGIAMQAEERLAYITRMVRYSGKPITAEQTAAERAAIDTTAARIELVAAKLDAFDAAPDDAAKRAVYETPEAAFEVKGISDAQEAT